jgi:acyl carrier protein
VDKIVKKIAEISDTEEDLVKPETELVDLEAWDSLAAVTFVAYAISEHDVKLVSDEVESAATVADLVELIKSKKAQ